MATTATLKATSDGPVQILPPNGQAIANVVCQGRSIPTIVSAGGSVLLHLKLGKKYEVRFRSNQ
jgi:hypothetical protein